MYVWVHHSAAGVKYPDWVLVVHWSSDDKTLHQPELQKKSRCLDIKLGDASLRLSKLLTIFIKEI